jgi:hypothetical protein
MNRTDELHPVELLILAAVLVAWAVVTIARTVLVPLVTLVLTIVSPSAAPPPPEAAEPAPAAPWLPPTLPNLEPLPVTTLRRLARAEGLPACLSRSGRRADLLLALAMAH